jgi:hypothetical protein
LDLSWKRAFSTVFSTDVEILGEKPNDPADALFKILVPDTAREL